MASGVLASTTYSLRRHDTGPHPGEAGSYETTPEGAAAGAASVRDSAQEQGRAAASYNILAKAYIPSVQQALQKLEQHKAAVQQQLDALAKELPEADAQRTHLQSQLQNATQDHALLTALHSNLKQNSAGAKESMRALELLTAQLREQAATTAAAQHRASLDTAAAYTAHLQHQAQQHAHDLAGRDQALQQAVQSAGEAKAQVSEAERAFAGKLQAVTEEANRRIDAGNAKLASEQQAHAMTKEAKQRTEAQLKELFSFVRYKAFDEHTSLQEVQLRHQYASALQQMSAEYAKRAMQLEADVHTARAEKEQLARALQQASTRATALQEAGKAVAHENDELRATLASASLQQQHLAAAAVAGTNELDTAAQEQRAKVQQTRKTVAAKKTKAQQTRRKADSARAAAATAEKKARQAKRNVVDAKQNAAKLGATVTTETQRASEEARQTEAVSKTAQNAAGAYATLADQSDQEVRDAEQSAEDAYRSLQQLEQARQKAETHSRAVLEHWRRVGVQHQQQRGELNASVQRALEVEQSRVKALQQLYTDSSARLRQAVEKHRVLAQRLHAAYREGMRRARSSAEQDRMSGRSSLEAGAYGDGLDPDLEREVRALRERLDRIGAEWERSDRKTLTNLTGDPGASEALAGGALRSALHQASSRIGRELIQSKIEHARAEQRYHASLNVLARIDHSLGLHDRVDAAAEALGRDVERLAASAGSLVSSQHAAIASLQDELRRLTEHKQRLADLQQSKEVLGGTMLRSRASLRSLAQAEDELAAASAELPEGEIQAESTSEQEEVLLRRLADCSSAAEKLAARHHRALLLFREMAARSDVFTKYRWNMNVQRQWLRWLNRNNHIVWATTADSEDDWPLRFQAEVFTQTERDAWQEEQQQRELVHTIYTKLGKLQGTGLTHDDAAAAVYAELAIQEREAIGAVMRRWDRYLEDLQATVQARPAQSYAELPAHMTRSLRTAAKHLAASAQVAYQNQFAHIRRDAAMAQRAVGRSRGSTDTQEEHAAALASLAQRKVAMEREFRERMEAVQQLQQDLSRAAATKTDGAELLEEDALVTQWIREERERLEEYGRLRERNAPKQPRRLYQTWSRCIQSSRNTPLSQLIKDAEEDVRLGRHMEPEEHASISVRLTPSTYRRLLMTAELGAPWATQKQWETECDMRRAADAVEQVTEEAWLNMSDRVALRRQLGTLRRTLDIAKHRAVTAQQGAERMQSLWTKLKALRTQELVHNRELEDAALAMDSELQDVALSISSSLQSLQSGVAMTGSILQSISTLES